MTDRAYTDRLLVAWFELEAPTRPPDGLRDAIIGATTGRRPRPAWLARVAGSHVATVPGGRVRVDLRLVVLLAGLALLAAVAAASLLAGSRPLSGIRPLPVRPVEIALTGPAAMAAVGDDAVWMAVEAPGAEGVGAAAIDRVDPATNEVTNLIKDPPAYGPMSLATLGGSVWAAAQGGRIREWDAATGALRRTKSIDYVTDGLVAAFGSLWMSDVGANSISRLDPATGQIVRIALPDRGQVSGNLPDEWAVFASDTAVFVEASDPAKLARIDPATNAVTPMTAPAGVCGIGFLAGLMMGSTCEPHRLVVLDPATLEVTGRFAFTTEADGYPAVASARGSLWFVARATDGTNTLVRVDPATLREVARYDLSLLDGKDCPLILAGLDSLWFATTDSSLIRVPLDAMPAL